VIIVLRPPDAAGPLRIGAAGQDTVDTLRQLGDPQVLCRTPGPGSLSVVVARHHDRRALAVLGTWRSVGCLRWSLRVWLTRAGGFG
jgi:hypothetical protein